MPPRKSGGSVASTQDDHLSIEDLNLPKTMVQRLAKGVLPANTQISKDALLAISKSATVFVNYLASHANENTQRQNKKTIQPKDVLDALKDIEFDFFEPRLSQELEKYNNMQCDKRNTYRRRIKEEAKAKIEEAGSGAIIDVAHAHRDPRDRPDPPGTLEDDGHVTYDEHDNKVRRRYRISSRNSRHQRTYTDTGREIWEGDVNPRHLQNRIELLERRRRERGDYSWPDERCLSEDENEFDGLLGDLKELDGTPNRDPKRVRRDTEDQQAQMKRNREATRRRIQEDWGGPNDPLRDGWENQNGGPRYLPDSAGDQDDVVGDGVEDQVGADGEDGEESEFESAEEEVDGEEEGEEGRDLVEDPLEEGVEEEEGEGEDEDDEMLDDGAESD